MQHGLQEKGRWQFTMTPEPIVFNTLGIIFFSEGFRVAKQNNLKVHGRKRCRNPSPGTRTENGCGAPWCLIWWRWGTVSFNIQFLYTQVSALCWETYHKTTQYACLIWIGFELLFKLYLFLFVLCLYVICTTCLQCLQWPEDGARFPESEVIDSCELSRGCWKSNPSVPEKQPVLLTRCGTISPAHIQLFLSCTYSFLWTISSPVYCSECLFIEIFTVHIIYMMVLW